MSRRAGGFRGAKPAWTTTSTPGVFGLSDVVDLKAAGQWPRGPAAPTNLAGTPGDGQVALTWTAPATTHGTITDYIVEYTPAAGSPTLVATGSTAASYTLTGLTNGTSYTVRVAAVNFTAGDYSAAVTQTLVAGTPPNAPTSLTATAGNAQMALAWTAPSAPGTSAITGYVVEYTPSGGSASTVNTNSTSTSYTLTGLTNATAYTVRVAAISAAGTGTYSATATGTPIAAQFTTVPTNQGQPTTGFGTAASPHSIYSPPPWSAFRTSPATWTAVAGVSGTLRITGEFGDAGEGYNGNISVGGVVVFSQSFGDYYDVNITRSITAGQSVVWEATSGAFFRNIQFWILGSVAPNAPTSLTATAGNAQIALAWTAPSAPGTSAITGYVVEYTPSGSSAATVNTNSTSTSYTLTGLTNGTEYSVRVRAVSAAGNGAYSVAITATPVGSSIAITGGAYAAGWAGAGTQASPFTRSNLGQCGFAGGLVTFTASGPGNVVVGVTNVTQWCGDNDDRVAVQKNGAEVGSLNFQGGAQTVSISVSSGDTVLMIAPSAHARPEGLSVYIA